MGYGRRLKREIGAYADNSKKKEILDIIDSFSGGAASITDTQTLRVSEQQSNPRDILQSTKVPDNPKKVDVNEMYDLYIFFLENGIEPVVRKKIKDILFYHGIYCPPEPKKAIDLKELVEKVKQSDETDDFKCGKCCQTVFAKGFHELFYALSNGKPAIPFGCHPYLLDDPMNRNTFLYIFGVSRYLHVAFPRCSLMELYFMTLCSAFGRDYWDCKRPDYQIEADVNHPMFFTTFYELSGDPEYYEVNLTPDQFLESNGQRFAERRRAEMSNIMTEIQGRMSDIKAAVRKNKFEEAQSNLGELTKDVQKANRRAKRVQEKAEFARIDLKQEIVLTDEDSEKMTEAKKQVIVFKLYAMETLSRKEEAIQKFIENAVTMIECTTDLEETSRILRGTVADIEELMVPLEQAMKERKEVTENEQGRITEQTQSEASALAQSEQAQIDAELLNAAKRESLTQKPPSVQGEEVSLKAEQRQIRSTLKDKLGLAITNNSPIVDVTELANSLIQTFEPGKRNAEDLEDLNVITDLLTSYNAHELTDTIEKFKLLKPTRSGGRGKTLRKRAIRNKTRNKLNRRSRRHK